MDVWLTIPPTWQAILVFVWGAVVGGQVNRGIYRLAWLPRPIGPWSDPPAGVPPRTWLDRVPILGWLRLRREALVVGRGFWIRPLLIELALAGGLTALYVFEMRGGLLPRAILALASPDEEMFLAQFFGHAILMALMAVATFIDFDEQTIPDAVTIPGTILGLVLAACLPVGGLPVVQKTGGEVGIEVVSLRLTSPHGWESRLDDWPGLATALFCWCAWCVALVPKRWTLRRGLSRAVGILLASAWRSGWCGPMAGLAVAGSLAFLGVWYVGDEWWRSLLSAVVGMAVGGAIVWTIRVVFGVVLGQEAMGFGDVTLMAMIGAFLGWQSTLVAFFLAPFAAIFIALGQWLLTGRRDLAFGPYLCLAAGFLVVRWEAVWHRSAVSMFQLGFEVPLIVGLCIVVMGPLVWMVRGLRLWLVGG